VSTDFFHIVSPFRLLPKILLPRSALSLEARAACTLTSRWCIVCLKRIPKTEFFFSPKRFCLLLCLSNPSGSGNLFLTPSVSWGALFFSPPWSSCPFIAFQIRPSSPLVTAPRITKGFPLPQGCVWFFFLNLVIVPQIGQKVGAHPTGDLPPTFLLVLPPNQVSVLHI